MVMIVPVKYAPVRSSRGG